jgi:hypothetical protein
MATPAAPATDTERLTKLAALLDVPNKLSWTELTALLLAWEREPGFEAAMAMASERLERWPDRLRMGELSWAESGSAVLSLARSCFDSHASAMVARGVGDRISTVTFPGSNPAFLGQLPSVTSVYNGKPGMLGALDETTLASLVEVSQEKPTLADLSLLAEKAPKLERLVLLADMQVKLGQQGLEILANGKFRLTHLLMGDQDLKGAKAGKTLATGAAFTNLQYLDLSDNPLADPFFKAFLARTHASLSFLRLQRVKLGGPGLEQLAASKSLPMLESLDISGDKGRDLSAEIPRLATLGNFPQLRRLNVEGLRAKIDTMVGLLSSSGLPRLEELRLDGMLDLPTLLPALPQTLSIPLRRLAFDGRGQGDVPWERLEWLRDLRVLSVPHLPESAAAALLARAPIAGLTALSIRHAELHGGGARLLAEIPFTRLRRLDVWGAKLFPDVIAPILDAPWLASLEEIRVEEQEVGQAATERFKELVKRVGPFDVLPSTSARDIQWFDPLAEDSLGAPAATEPVVVAPAPTPLAEQAAAPPAPPPASDPAATAPATSDASAEPLAPFASSAAACGPILALVRDLADEATFGKAKLEKGKLILDKGAWTLCVAVKAVSNRSLEAWQRVGINLSVEVTARIPQLERALDPSLTDKAYAKLPFSPDAPVRPTLLRNLPPPVGHGWLWQLSRVGGPNRMAAHIVESLRAWVPAMSSMEELAHRAAHTASELTGKGLAPDGLPSEPRLSFGITAGLTAALAFFVSGDASRAKVALDAWLAHPDIQRFLANPDVSWSRDGTSFTSRELRTWADKVTQAIS